MGRIITILRNYTVSIQSGINNFFKGVRNYTCVPSYKHEITSKVHETVSECVIEHKHNDVDIQEIHTNF